MRIKNKLKVFSAVILILVIVVSSSMVFAADPNTWTIKAPMNTARYKTEAVTVNGQIYVVGGYATGGLSSVEQYDPATNTWMTKTPMANARSGHKLAVVDGKIYAIGGSGTLKAVEEYNPATDTWTTKAPMNTERSNFEATVLNGKIYVVGGNGLNSVEEYDPVNNTWTTKASMSVARMQFKVAVLEGKIYAIGGYDGKTELNLVEEYDPSTNTWTTKTPLQMGRRMFEIAVLNHKIYAIAGYSSTNTQVKSSIEEYDPTTNTWTIKKSMPTYSATAGEVAELSGKIYIVGADGSKTVEEYDPVKDNWIYDASMSTSRTSHSIVVLNDKLYAIGGTSGGTVLKSVEEYTPTSTEDGGTENPPVVTGNSAILELTMVNGVIKEYDLNADELDSFLTWYDNSSIGSAPAYYIFNKKNNIKPFLNRKEYIAYSKIASFEVKEYAE